MPEATFDSDGRVKTQGNEVIVIVDDFIKPVIVVVDFATLSNEELVIYVSNGYPDAIDEYMKRHPFAGDDVDPYAPVELPPS